MSLHVHKNFYLHLHSYSSLVKTWFSTHRQDFSALSLPQPVDFINSQVFLARGYSIYFSLQGLIRNRLAMTKSAWIWWPWNWGKKGDIHTYIHTCIQTYMYRKLSNRAGIGHRQHRLFMYATWNKSRLHSNKIWVLYISF